MMLTVKLHPVIDWSVKLFGKKEKACTFYRGIYSAHAHYELGVTNCKFIETRCVSRGSGYCVWSYNYFKKPPKEIERLGVAQSNQWDQIQTIQHVL